MHWWLMAKAATIPLLMYSITTLLLFRCLIHVPGRCTCSHSSLPLLQFFLLALALQLVEEMCTRWKEFCDKQTGRYLDLSSDKKREEVRQLLWKGLPMADKCRGSRVKLWERCRPRLSCGDLVCVFAVFNLSCITRCFSPTPPLPSPFTPVPRPSPPYSAASTDWWVTSRDILMTSKTAKLTTRIFWKLQSLMRCVHMHGNPTCHIIHTQRHTMHVHTLTHTHTHTRMHAHTVLA